MDETITGTDGDDVLNGTNASETILGGAGDDRLRGRGGDDVLQGGAGNDFIVGGGGFDVLDYSDFDQSFGDGQTLDSGDGVVLDMREPDSGGFVLVRVDRDDDGVFEEVDRVQVTLGGGRGIEALRTSQSDDIFTGNDEDNTVFGSSGGDDVFVGGGGTDTLDYTDAETRVFLSPSGEAGTLLIDKPSDPSDLVSGFETILSDPERPGTILAGPDAFRLAEAEALDVDLAEGRAVLGDGEFTLAIAGFRDVRTGGGDDRVVGDAQDNTFIGSRGDDAYLGGDGRDRLVYGDDVDAAFTLGLDGVVTLRDGDDAVVGRDTVARFDLEAGQVDFIEGIGTDNFFRDDDVLDGSADGGLPLSLRVAGSDVRAVFEEDAGGFSAGDAFGFDAVGFGRVTGTAFDDDLAADRFVAVVFDGGAGDDRLRGGALADVLRGEEGDDRLLGGPGVDVLFGGEGADRLVGQEDVDILDGGLGADVLTGGSGADLFLFSEQAIVAEDPGFDVVQDFSPDDRLEIAVLEVSARDAFGLAQVGGVAAGIAFGLDAGGTEIVLRADGLDEDLTIDADEVFARLRIDPDEFLG